MHAYYDVFGKSVGCEFYHRLFLKTAMAMAMAMVMFYETLQEGSRFYAMNLMILICFLRQELRRELR
jgi:hypothetical protein